MFCRRSFYHGLQKSLARSFSSSKKGEWYNFAKTMKQTDAEGEASLNLFGAFAQEYDVARPSYPMEMWEKFVEDAVGKKH